MIVQNATLQNVLTYFEVSENYSGNNIIVKVLDMSGKIAKTIRQTLEESVDRICLNMEDLCKGKYIINIFTEESFVKAFTYIKE